MTPRKCNSKSPINLRFLTQKYQNLTILIKICWTLKNPNFDFWDFDKNHENFHKIALKF